MSHITVARKSGPSPGAPMVGVYFKAWQLSLKASWNCFLGCYSLWFCLTSIIAFTILDGPFLQVQAVLSHSKANTHAFTLGKELQKNECGHFPLASLGFWVDHAMDAPCHGCHGMDRAVGILGTFQTLKNWRTHTHKAQGYGHESSH